MVFQLFQKLHQEINASQFMTSKLFHFHLLFWIWKVQEGKLQKSEYLKSKNSFFDEIKNIFYSFWWKHKKLPKIADTIFQNNPTFGPFWSIFPILEAKKTPITSSRSLKCLELCWMYWLWCCVKWYRSEIQTWWSLGIAK